MQEPNEDIEIQYWLQGSSRTYSTYIEGILSEFCAHQLNAVHIYVDNLYFTKVLQKGFHRNSHIHCLHKKITKELIDELLTSGPIICHIDTHTLGDYSHASHFIVIERNLTKNRYMIIDPWNGKKRRVTHIKMIRSIHSLKTHIKMCPLLIQIKKG